MNIFERASRKKLRFMCGKGPLTTEQLWDLPLLDTGNGVSLNNMAVTVNRKLREAGEESFVEVKVNPEKVDDELRLEILKHIISAKQAAATAAEKAAATRERRRKLLDALERQEDAELGAMSAEDIRKELDAMG